MNWPNVSFRVDGLCYFFFTFFSANAFLVHNLLLELLSFGLYYWGSHSPPTLRFPLGYTFGGLFVTWWRFFLIKGTWRVTVPTCLCLLFFWAVHCLSNYQQDYSSIAIHSIPRCYCFWLKYILQSTSFWCAWRSFQWHNYPGILGNFESSNFICPFLGNPIRTDQTPVPPPVCFYICWKLCLLSGSVILYILVVTPAIS